MQKHLARFRANGWTDAAENLEFYLSPQITPRERRFSREKARSFEQIRNAEERIRRHFEEGTFIGVTENNPAPRALRHMGEGGDIRFKDSWDGAYENLEFWIDIIGGDGNFANAFGETLLVGKGDFRASRRGENIHVSGTVTFTWRDEYDFNKGAPGSEQAQILETNGLASQFTIIAEWRQNVQGFVRTEHQSFLSLFGAPPLELHGPEFTWTDLN